MDPSGAALKHCLSDAMAHASIEKADLYVSSARGDTLLDQAEEAVIASLPEETHVSVPQALVGTPLGASAGYAVLNALYSFEKGEVTGMPAGDYALREAAGRKLTIGKNTPAEVKTACIAASGFGGTYASVVLGKGDCL